MTQPPVRHAGARHSALLASWMRAWRAGFVPYDEVASAVAGDEEHFVADLPGQESDIALHAALAMFSRLTPDRVRLVLPAPGDPRGLPGPGAFTDAALVAGEAVVAGELGLVPWVRMHTSGSGDTWHTVCWRVFTLPAVAGERIAVGEAERELTHELTAAVEALTTLDVTRWQPELAGALAALRRPAPGVGDLPAGYGPRARRLYARAVMVNELLALADRSTPGGAVNAYEAAQRFEALRPLRTACRRAAMAACNSPLG